MEIDKVKKLSLCELLGLYNNYVIVRGANLRSEWSVITEREFTIVDAEIKKRLIEP